MIVQYSSVNPVGEPFTSRKGSILRRWLLVSGRDVIAVLASTSWVPKVPKDIPLVCEIGGLRVDASGLATGFVRENR